MGMTSPFAFIASPKRSPLAIFFLASSTRVAYLGVRALLSSLAFLGVPWRSLSVSGVFFL
jgi:hypothetical protein